METIHSTLFHTLNLLSFLLYPTNAITRPHMPLETSRLAATIVILGLKFSHTIKGPHTKKNNTNIKL